MNGNLYNEPLTNDFTTPSNSTSPNQYQTPIQENKPSSPNETIIVYKSPNDPTVMCDIFGFSFIIALIIIVSIRIIIKSHWAFSFIFLFIALACAARLGCISLNSSINQDKF